jgi:hypothetical protein
MLCVSDAGQHAGKTHAPGHRPIHSATSSQSERKKTPAESGHDVAILAMQAVEHLHGLPFAEDDRLTLAAKAISAVLPPAGRLLPRSPSIFASLATPRA